MFYFMFLNKCLNAAFIPVGMSRLSIQTQLMICYRGNDPLYRNADSSNAHLQIDRF